MHLSKEIEENACDPATGRDFFQRAAPHELFPGERGGKSHVLDFIELQLSPLEGSSPRLLRVSTSQTRRSSRARRSDWRLVSRASCFRASTTGKQQSTGQRANYGSSSCMTGGAGVTGQGQAP